MHHYYIGTCPFGLATSKIVAVNHVGWTRRVRSLCAMIQHGAPTLIPSPLCVTHVEGVEAGRQSFKIQTPAGNTNV